ncbi:hypothetical protein [Microlunatus speluncae]|uniref:hypothetical protein n=1 Tax=Microlunatus speluncae TaxID=2594267 RepID=UPI001375C8D4|nr:hypothetical protein [Microlunatus speluncae]
MQGPIHLGGGGSERDEARLWAEAFPPGARVAVWPFAQSDPGSGATPASGSPVPWPRSARTPSTSG